MWKRSSGFTMLEVLAALLIWMVMATMLLPMLVMINQERKNEELEQEVRLVLTSVLDKLRVDQDPYFQKEVVINGRTLFLTKNFDLTIPRLCLEYEDFRNRQRQRCVYWHE